MAALLLLTPGAAAAQRAADVVLDSATIARSSGGSLARFLAGRVPGLVVHHVDGAPNVAERVAAMGTSGSVASPEPMLFIDGVLVRDDAHWSTHAEATPSSLGWGFPIDEIAEIRVVLGSASGADVPFGAPRGAVFVTTRRAGPSGRHLDAFVRSSVAAPRVESRANEGATAVDGTGALVSCTLASQSVGQCVPFERVAWAPLIEQGPFAAAAGLNVGVDASGDAGGWRYRASLRNESTGGTVLESGVHRLDVAFALDGPATNRVQLGARVGVAHIGGRQATWEDLTAFDIARSVGARATPTTRAAFNQQVAFRRLQGYVTNTRRVTLDGTAGWRGLGLEWRAQASADQLTRRSDRIAPILIGGVDYAMRLRAAVPTQALSLSVRRHQAIGGRVELETEAAAHWMRTRFADARHDISPISGAVVWRWDEIASVTSLVWNSRLLVGERFDIGAGVRNEQLRGASQPLGTSADVGLVLWRGRGALRSQPRLRLFASGASSSDHRTVWSRFGEFGSQDLAELERTRERRVGFSSALATGVHLRIEQSRHAVSDGVLCCRTMATFPESVAPVPDAGWRTDATLARLDVVRGIGPSGTLTLGFSVLQRRTIVTRLPQPVISRLDFVELRGMAELGRGPLEYRSLGYSYADANDDGILGPGEVTYSDVALRLGSPDPRWIVASTGHVALAGGLEIGATVEARLGHVVFDGVEAARCDGNRCRALYEPGTPLAVQAAAIAVRDGGRVGGFVHPADHLRLRELYLAWPVGPHRLRVSVHQILLLSRFPHGDPEAVNLLGGLSTGVVGSRHALAPSLSIRLDIGG